MFPNPKKKIAPNILGVRAPHEMDPQFVTPLLQEIESSNSNHGTTLHWYKCWLKNFRVPSPLEADPFVYIRFYETNRAWIWTMLSHDATMMMMPQKYMGFWAPMHEMNPSV